VVALGVVVGGGGGVVRGLPGSGEETIGVLGFRVAGLA